jgi:hypothetical protein
LTTGATEDGQKPLCFVLTPFGIKTDGAGVRIDFDRLYKDVIRPAVLDAGMEPLRADEEHDGGLIHKPMFERLVLCAFAIADLTLANANVFYELGIRHAVRPHTTMLLFAKGGQRLPFDVAPLRAAPYDVAKSGRVKDASALRAVIVERLENARDPSNDSPVYQLLEGFVPPDIARLKTDVFRNRVRYNDRIKSRLAQAREAPSPVDAVVAVQGDLAPLEDQEAGVLIDLLLSYRDIGEFQAIVDLVEQFPLAVAGSVLVREQLALALNRCGRGARAEEILRKLLDEQGPSSETLGILGRVYKDRWSLAVSDGDSSAGTLLQRAIDAYQAGFEADWRDSFPGVNAVTLMEIQQPGQASVGVLAPIVQYSTGRRIANGVGDFWDQATLLELAVLARDDAQTEAQLGAARAGAPDRWMVESTANNLSLIANAREACGEPVEALRDLILRLLQ